MRSTYSKISAGTSSRPESISCRFQQPHESALTIFRPVCNVARPVALLGVAFWRFHDPSLRPGCTTLSVRHSQHVVVYTHGQLGQSAHHESYISHELVWKLLRVALLQILARRIFLKLCHF